MEQEEVRRKLPWQAILKLTVTVALLIIIFRFVPIETIWDGIKRLSPLVWFSVLAAFVFGHLINAFKWHLLVGDRLPFVTVAKAHFAGLASNLVLPGTSGGDVTRAALIAKESGSLTHLVTGSLVDRLIDVSVLVLLAAIAAGSLASSGQAGQVLQISAGVILISGLVIYAGLPPFNRWFTAKFSSETAPKPVKLALEISAFLSRFRNRILICLAISALVQTSFVALNWGLSASMGGPLSFWAWMFAWPAAKLIATLPISLGGLGVREASLASVFAGIGMGSPVVVAVGLIWQTIILGGGLFGLAVQFISRRTRTEELSESNVRTN